MDNIITSQPFSQKCFDFKWDDYYEKLWSIQDITIQQAIIYLLIISDLCMGRGLCCAFSIIINITECKCHNWCWSCVGKDSETGFSWAWLYFFQNKFDIARTNWSEKIKELYWSEKNLKQRKHGIDEKWVVGPLKKCSLESLHFIKYFSFLPIHILPQTYSPPHTKVPPLGKYCTKYLIMTVIYLLMRKTTVRLTIVRVCNHLTLKLSAYFNSSHFNNIHKSLLLWHMQC